MPLFLRGVTAEKFGFKNGEGITDLVDSLLVAKAEIAKEIQTLGVMSDFQPAQKQIESYPGEEILFVVDKAQKYGEMFLLCFTEAAKEEFLSAVREKQEAIEAQKRAEEEAEAARAAAEYARLNVVYEDKPIEARPWMSAFSAETEQQVAEMTSVPCRECIVLEVTRPKKLTKLAYRFLDRNAEVGGVSESRSTKDPNFKSLRESDMGFQAAPINVNSFAQTTWHRPVNKAIQYEAATAMMEPTEGESKDSLFSFLERAIVTVETALQQNESVDIFNETFRLAGDDEAADGAHAENELRELKNFADPTYSKSKALVAIDWLPKSAGMLAVSAVRNISLDQRNAVSGAIHTSHLLLWDFRQLVRPAVLLQCHHEVLAFRFNKVNQGLVAGGCMTGQVVLWDINAALSSTSRRGGNKGGDGDEDDNSQAPVSPKYISNVDHSHKRPVADLFWLPPNTQINFRGQLVGQEHLDDKSYQFVTVAGDGVVMVWDIRYEQIAADELRHIAKAKHVPMEKANKDGAAKVLWAPIFKAALKRTEGVGELSLSSVCCTGLLKSTVSSKSELPGDFRSHLLIGTEEGDILFADICVPKSGATKAHGEDDEEEQGESVREFVRWLQPDHSRPAVAIQQSPFFPDILLSVSDWNFHLWKVGQNKPFFVSPNSNTYLTAGSWSPTRPAVVITASADGHLLAWDFTDSSYRPSVELKATHARITSMEFLTSANANTRQQLLAIGDETGTLHVLEIPRNLVRHVPKEEAIMHAFIDREFQKQDYLLTIPEILGFDGTAGASHGKAHDDEAHDFGGGGGGVAPPPPPTAPRGATAPGTAGGAMAAAGTAAGGGEEGEELMDESKKAERERLKKEEEEFLKLEASFITELGLKHEELPELIRKQYPQPSANEKT